MARRAKKMWQVVGGAVITTIALILGASIGISYQSGIQCNIIDTNTGDIKENKLYIEKKHSEALEDSQKKYNEIKKQISDLEKDMKSDNRESKKRDDKILDMFRKYIYSD